MVRAVLDDLQAIPGVSPRILLDSRIPSWESGPEVELFRVSDRNEAEELFHTLAVGSEGTLLIAPELDGTLENLARQVRRMGGNLLGCLPEAIQLASDKLLLPRILRRRGVPCIPSTVYRGANGTPYSYPCVLKPRHGAGSTRILLVEHPDELPVAEQPTVMTPLVAGLPASVLVMAGPRGRVALTACEQLISRDGRFRYLGGRLPLSMGLDARAGKLALGAVASIPGLAGFVGVDVLLDLEDAESPDDRVVEVNSRLTTSYVGLRALSGVNLAACWLQIVSGEEPPPLCWKPGPVLFRPDGSVEVREG